MFKNNPIKNFRDLKVWQKSHQLALEIYKITKLFPKEEIFGLTSQMRRCSVSVTSNIAEGFNRKSYKEKNNFYHISLGSVSELQSQILICQDINYLSQDKSKKLLEKSIEIHKMLNSLIKTSKSHYS